MRVSLLFSQFQKKEAILALERSHVLACLSSQLHKEIVSAWSWQAAIKKIKVPTDVLSEEKNHIVNTNKIMPENFFSYLVTRLQTGSPSILALIFPKLWGKRTSILSLRLLKILWNRGLGDEVQREHQELHVTSD